MNRKPRKYVLDTNLFVDGFRDPAANAQLQRFHELFGPFEYMSAVVAAELRAGTRSTTDLHRLERWIILPFERRARLVTPSYRAWSTAGDALSALARHEGLVLATVSKAFFNDLLIATSCREAGIVVVTRNVRDFERIARVAPCEYVKAWPGA